MSNQSSSDLLSQLKENRKLLRSVFSALAPISFFIGKEHKYHCPFHDDNTPSAKLYSGDEDGIEKLYCFACRKHYLSYDWVVMNHPGVSPLNSLIEEFGEQAVLDEANKQLLNIYTYPDWDDFYKNLWEETKGNVQLYVKKVYDYEDKEND